MGEGFPLWSLVSMAWEGREPLRDWICLSVFLPSVLVPFHRFVYIWRSVTPIGLKPSPWFFLPKISFLAAEEGHQPPYGWPMRVRGAPCLVATSGTVSRWFFFPFHKYSKNILHPLLFRLDSVWYGIFAKHKTCNKQELALGTGSIC